MRQYIPYLAVKLLNVLHISGLKMFSKLAQNTRMTEFCSNRELYIISVRCNKLNIVSRYGTEKLKKLVTYVKMLVPTFFLSLICSFL